MLILDGGKIVSVSMDAVDGVADLVQSLEVYVGKEFHDRG
jgi:hypothetical protein